MAENWLIAEILTRHHGKFSRNELPQGTIMLETEAGHVVKIRPGGAGRRSPRTLRLL